MVWDYIVTGEEVPSHKGETLSAQLVCGDPQILKVVYSKEGGIIQIDFFRDGKRNGKLERKIGYEPFEPEFIGIFKIYNDMGPELRKKIPPDWQNILGEWLKSEFSKRPPCCGYKKQ